MLRVLCRYLTRVSDRTARLNDTPTDRRLSNDHRAVLSERLHRARARGRGRGVHADEGTAEGEGFIRERLFPTHPCARTPTVGPLRGRGPRPLFPPGLPSLVPHCLGSHPRRIFWTHAGTEFCQPHRRYRILPAILPNILEPRRYRMLPPPATPPPVLLSHTVASTCRAARARVTTLRTCVSEPF